MAHQTKIAVFDLDGTIADITHRLKYVDQKPKDWKTFFAKCSDDAPIPATIAWMHYMHNTHKIVILSGRSEEVREQTVKWLHWHKVPYNALFMRKAGDHRPDTDVKAEMMKKYVNGIGEVDFIVDDRPVVIDMWRDMGHTVYAVTGKSWEGRA